MENSQRQSAELAIQRLIIRHKILQLFYKRERAAKELRKEEPNVTVYASPIYKENGGVCTETIEIHYKEKIIVVLRSSLTDYHRAKLGESGWGKIRVKLSTLKKAY